MKRASYREAVAWIAVNDGSGDDEAYQEDHVASMVTVQLIATIFQQDASQVAFDVVRFRIKEYRKNGEEK